MLSLTAMVQAFFNDISGQAALAVLGLGFVDWLLGISAAWRDRVLTWSALDAWLRSNLAGRIMPIWVLLVFGFLARDIKIGEIPLVTTFGMAGALGYITATVAGIAEKWGPNHVRQDIPSD